MDIEGLNNRETAIAIWLGAGLIWALCKASMRESFGGLIKSFLACKVLSIYLSSVAYTCAGIYILCKLHLWTFHELKDAILWCIVPILKALLNLADTKKQKSYFEETIKDTFKFTIIVEFITEAFTFSLIAELVLVPVLVILGGTLAVAQSDEKHAPVKKLINFLLVSFFLISIGHALYEITHHFTEFASLEKLREFLLAPLLGFWFVPWLFFLSILSRIEVAFLMLKFSFADARLRMIAKRKAFIAFAFDVKGLERWKNRLHFYEPKNEKDIDYSIKDIKALQKTEKNAPEVKSSLGWSPYAAKDFLITKGIETGYYQNIYEEEWAALSPYIRIREDFMAIDNISYYVKGNKTTATMLELIITITPGEHEQQTIDRMIDSSKHLYTCATLGKELSAAFIKKMKERKNYQEETGGITITVRKEEYQNTTRMYSYTFRLNHRSSV